jgi:hypothetical protein
LILPRSGQRVNEAKSIDDIRKDFIPSIIDFCENAENKILQLNEALPLCREGEQEDVAGITD